MNKAMLRVLVIRVLGVIAFIAVVSCRVHGPERQKTTGALVVFPIPLGATEGELRADRKNIEPAWPEGLYAERIEGDRFVRVVGYELRSGKVCHTGIGGPPDADATREALQEHIRHFVAGVVRAMGTDYDASIRKTADSLLIEEGRLEWKRGDATVVCLFTAPWVDTARISPGSLDPSPDLTDIYNYSLRTYNAASILGPPMSLSDRPNIRDQVKVEKLAQFLKNLDSISGEVWKPAW